MMWMKLKHSSFTAATLKDLNQREIIYRIAGKLIEETEK